MKLVVGAPTAEATNGGVRVAEAVIIIKYSATVNLRRLLLRKKLQQVVDDESFGRGQIYVESNCCVWISAAVKLKTVINAKLNQNCGDCSRI